MKLHSSSSYSCESSVSEKSEDSRCGVCERLVTAEQWGLHCDVCMQWTHVECVCESENSPGITEDVYRRLGDKQFEFHCPRCKTSEEPSFLQSIYDCHIITEEEVEPLDWKDYVVVAEVTLESDEALGTGDASTAVKQTAVASGS